MSQNNNKPQDSWSEEAFISSLSETGTHAPTFNPTGFLIPGWHGEGLITTSSLSIKKLLSNLTIDALSLFKKLSSTRQSVKVQAYEEFLLFAEYAKIDRSLITHQNDFWIHLQDDSSPLKKHIDDFLKIYCFRAVAIYLFRIKFLLDISNELGIKVNEDTLVNPLSFLGRIFVKDSSSELNCASLQVNQYSWYRPSAEYKESLFKLKEAFSAITLTELTKIISTPKVDKVYSIRNYSHTLSHLSFGQLMIELLIKFPNWKKPEALQSQPLMNNNKLCILPKTVNTKFIGNHVSSLALSHWLAQENNVKIGQWDNLICPDFEGIEFIDGEFLKICQELQFLSFLTRIASAHRYEIVSFICKIMNKKNARTLEDGIGQNSFFNLHELANGENLYNRVILNLADLPKVNPHHYLIGQIQAQKSILKKDAYIYVLTNQKLFVPSHSERIEQLLKDFKVEASISFEELKGKGEIPNFCYILTVREDKLKSNKHLFEVKRKLKESCLTFELKGNLSRFNKFQDLVKEMQTFIKTKSAVTTPMYSSEIDKELTFEFHQDAIIDGKLVSSVANKDSVQMTHPRFFKNLTNSSVPLDTFFNIESISYDEFNGKRNFSNELLGIKHGPEKQFPLLLIINQNDPLDVRIELTLIDAYRGKLEQYGTTFHTYFGLTPKHAAINLNVFREYFSSPIGHQIIQMQLSDGQTKLKAKLKSLLIPSFFANTQVMPENVKQTLKLLDFDAPELRNIDPNELLARFEETGYAITTHSKNYAWHILGLLSHFKLQINSIIEELEDSKPQTHYYNNSFISNKLIKLKTYPIYTKNEDVFVEFKLKSELELQLPMTSFTVKNNEDVSVLIIKSNEREVLSLHADAVMINFLKFIFQALNGIKIADILMNLKVPRTEELRLVTKEFETLKETNLSLLNSTEKLITSILASEISR